VVVLVTKRKGRRSETRSRRRTLSTPDLRARTTKKRSKHRI
jgi:hypothetical protein